MRTDSTLSESWWMAMAAAFPGRWCDGVVTAGTLMLRENAPISLVKWEAAMDGLQAAVDRAIAIGEDAPKLIEEQPKRRGARTRKAAARGAKRTAKAVRK